MTRIFALGNFILYLVSSSLSLDATLECVDSSAHSKVALNSKTASDQDQTLLLLGLLKVVLQ